MNPHKEAWCQALESGDYEQTQEGFMKVENVDGVTRYCCLGVAAKMAGCPFVLDSTKDQGYAVIRADFDGEDETDLVFLPNWLNDAMGLTSDDNEILAMWNDDGASFADIAAAVRDADAQNITLRDWDGRVRSWIAQTEESLS